MNSRYYLKDYEPPHFPPKTQEESAARLMLCERQLFATKGRPSDLRQQVQFLQAEVAELKTKVDSLTNEVARTKGEKL
jgi:uncharacterized protein YlxW (UPF0749 family)